MTLTEYEHYHRYDIWSIDLDDDGEDECVGYVKTVWEDEREIDDYLQLLNDNSCKYQYFYRLAEIDKSDNEKSKQGVRSLSG